MRAYSVQEPNCLYLSHCVPQFSQRKIFSDVGKKSFIRRNNNVLLFSKISSFVSFLCSYGDCSVNYQQCFETIQEVMLGSDHSKNIWNATCVYNFSSFLCLIGDNFPSEAEKLLAKTTKKHEKCFKQIVVCTDRMGE